MKYLLLLFCILSVAACASSPLKLDGVDRSITPAMVSAEHAYIGMRVVWGGTIIRTQPLQHTTQIEVLAFPVDSRGEPDPRAASLGRFLIENPGFLEPADFAPGRRVTVVGTIAPAQMGTVGQASYRFPVIHAQQLSLWPQGSGTDTRTFFHFGIGVQF